MKKVISLVLLAVMILSPVMLTGCSKKINIDLKASTQVSFSGYNGEGSIRVDIDQNKIASLLGEMNIMTVASVVDSFKPQEVSNNNTLKNGDKVKVKIDYDKDIMNNAKVRVSNSEFDVVVEGLKEKEKLDVFENVTLEVNGTSPECTIKVSYNGNELNSYSFEIVDADNNKRYKNGDKVTVKILDNMVENLKKQYIIDETSREFTVQADSSYILTAADLDDQTKQVLDKAADDFINETKESILKDNTNEAKNARITLFSAISGVNKGSLLAGYSWEAKIQPAKFNSAYAGACDVAEGWSTKRKNCIFYVYEADISYNINNHPGKYEGEGICAMMARIEDPKITAEGVTYSRISFVAMKDFDTAYNALIKSEFEKLF